MEAFGSSDDAAVFVKTRSECFEYREVTAEQEGRN